MGHKDCSSSTSYHGIHALKLTVNDPENRPFQKETRAKAPENRPFQKETIVFSIPTIHFQVRLLFVSGRVSLINQFLTATNLRSLTGELTPEKWMVEKSFYCKTSRQLKSAHPPTKKEAPSYGTRYLWHGTMARLNGHYQVCEQRKKC